MNTVIILLIALNLGTGVALIKAYMDRDMIVEAARDLYYAAWWYPDRPVDTADLWGRLRDVCGFQPAEHLGPARKTWAGARRDPL